MPTTNDSARLIRLLGFRAGQTFTLLRRTPAPLPITIEHANIALLQRTAQTDVIALDQEVFGMVRSAWIEALMQDSANQFWGSWRNNQLVAALCLRPRHNDTICIDMANARNFIDLRRLVEWMVATNAEKRWECFVRTDSPLHQTLMNLGFTIPEFFQEIGPLIEWRKGVTGDVGLSQHMQCLSWF